MSRAERRDRNGMRPPVAALGFGNVVGALADEGEIVQRAREVGMQRAEGRFLDGGGFAQQALGGGIVAGVDGLLAASIIDAGSRTSVTLSRCLGFIGGTNNPVGTR